MKKKLYFSILILFFIFVVNSIPSFADYTNYNMGGYYINNFDVYAFIDESGNMRVKERISYNCDENKKSITRTLSTNNYINKNNSANELEVIGVLIDGEACDIVTSAMDGQNLVYTVFNNSDEYKINVFSPFTVETKTIEIEYLLKDIAVKYKDTAEIFWNFLGESGSAYPINNFNVHIVLPSNAKTGRINAYAYGTKNGQITRINNNIIFNASNIQAYTSLDYRILFENDVISSSKHIINKSILGKYKNKENAFIPKREAVKILGYFTVKDVAEKLSLTLLLIWFATYVFYDKEYVVEKQKYYKEIPNNLEPEMIYYLLVYE